MAGYLGMTVAEIYQTMPSSEFERWRVLEWVDPWGQRRADFQFGMLASVVANALGAKNNGQPFSANDFLLQFKQVAETGAERKRPAEQADKPTTFGGGKPPGTVNASTPKQIHGFFQMLAYQQELARLKEQKKPQVPS